MSASRLAFGVAAFSFAAISLLVLLEALQGVFTPFLLLMFVGLIGSIVLRSRETPEQDHSRKTEVLVECLVGGGYWW